MLLAVVVDAAPIHHFTEAIGQGSHNFAHGLMELLGAFLGQFANAVGVVRQEPDYELLKGRHEGHI
jgi:hypothetical protein